MKAPAIDQSTREERVAYVLETLYTDYIEGKRTYMDVTLEVRKTCM